MNAQTINFDAEWASAHEWARMYRGLGLQVVPAGEPKPGGNWKRPIIKWEEFENSLVPEAQYDRWYHPQTGEYRARPNMGFITGLASGGVFCVDLDVYKTGAAAGQWWGDLLAENTHGQEPLTPAQRTGGGGRQILFRAPAGWAPPTFKTTGGIDVRGQGGFMMAPPSRHESGKDYDWEPGRAPWEVPVVDAEEWLIEAIEALRDAHAGEVGSSKRERTAGGDEFNAFGMRTDGREEDMTRSVWGAMLDIRRKHPSDIPPAPFDISDELERVWGQYLQRTKSRLTPRPGVTNADLLDLEGRGRLEFLRKWRRAQSQWNGKLKAEADKPRPGEPKPQYAEQPDGSFVDTETGEVFEPDPPKDAPPPGDFPDHLTRVPGLVGDIIDWIESTSRYPQRALALCVALGVVGTVAGRKYATPTRSGTHLYLLALAPTGAGKNHAPKQGKLLLRAAGLSELRGPSRYMSMSAVFAELAKKPRHIAFIDEFGAEMRRITTKGGSPHERAVKDVLRTAWGASFEELAPLSYADGRALEPIMAPSLSICGMSTPEEFYSAIAGDDIFNGFLNRFLVLRTAFRPKEVEPPVDEFEAPGKILWSIARIIDRVSGRISSAMVEDGKPVVRLDWATPAAREVYTTLKRSIEAREEDEALLSRVAEMACRLATIRAIGRGLDGEAMPAVTVEDMEWGRDLAMLSAEGMISDAQNYMTETEHQARTMRVLRVIKEGGKTPIKRSALLRKLQHHFDSRTLNSILEGLIEAEQVAEIEGQTTAAGGRKAVSYVAL